jgi:hypothetical protein
MSNTHTANDHCTLQILVIGSMLMGLTFLGLGGVAHLTASITGQGSIVQYAVQPETGVLQEPQATLAPVAHSAAPILAGTSTLAGVTIVLGMMLILTGLLLHALLLLRTQKDRIVPVHAAARDRTTVERNARHQRAIEVYWVEQTIRL